MATGYNATSLEELCDEYASYKSNDWEESESEHEEGMLATFNKMKLDDKLNFIRDDEFEIESSITPFDQRESH